MRSLACPRGIPDFEKLVHRRAHPGAPVDPSEHRARRGPGGVLGAAITEHAPAGDNPADAAIIEGLGAALGR